MNDYIMYLRKSRADNPEESVDEILAKHYTILQEFCVREFGFQVPEENIYREIVSGESINDRIEIKKVLARIEDSSIKGVIVVEPQRLSRGDLVDCGKLIDTFRYSNTIVITPNMTYDVNNKMERRFFQDELLRGRDYLEYTKEILMRGRIAAVKKGCFIQSIPPYGYDKIKLGKDWTLVPNQHADNVRLIFDMYNDGFSPNDIKKKLERQGIKSAMGSDSWRKESITKILKNYHYIGKVTFQRRIKHTKVVDGEKVDGRKYQSNFVIAEGKHPAIIEESVFNLAQERFASHPPVKENKELHNMFAGILFCSKCGRAIQYKMSPGRNIDKYYVCNTVGCSKTIPYGLFNTTVVESLEQSELPNLVAKWKNGDGSSVLLQKKKLNSLKKELEQLSRQEEKQYELLETGKYTQELFDKRNIVVRDKIDNVTKQIEETRKLLPNAIDYEERIAALNKAVSAINDPDVSVRKKNVLLKSIIERIELTSNRTSHKTERDWSMKIKLRL